MKKSRFTETQIIKVLMEIEGGRQVKGVCRESASWTRPTTPGKASTAARRRLI